MAEYIEREALLKELQEEIDFETTMYTEEQNKWFTVGLKCAVRDVKRQPTADVVEIKHGKWIRVVDDNGKRRNFLYECSECGRGIVCVDGLEKFPYCLCGAKMDGKCYE